jgi:single-stranded-DNA-specific exonuclease
LVELDWEISKPDSQAVSELRSAGFSRIIASLLVLRGFCDVKSAKSFLNCGTGFYDPMLLKGMREAASRISQALEMGEKITVYGDYDADGVSATALLYTYLRQNGADVCFYIPDRQNEGYGLNPDAAEKIAKDGTKLVITVDTGISAFDEAEIFSSLGVCLIITDHHDTRETLPDAFSVVNPKQADCAYPYKELAGVGVAFKLICALEQQKSGGMSAHSLFQKYGELVCLGTVADIVPLTGENRYIVCKGLELISKCPSVGMAAILEAAGVHGHVTSSILGYTVAPRINACGRIACANEALELLTEKQPEIARELANKLNQNNNERREIEDQILKESIEKIDGNEALRNNPVLIVSGEGWHNGVIGIVASRLVELYGKPAVVVSFEGDIGRASCRSIKGFNIHEALMKCGRYLEHFGGHELAAGFTVKRENYDTVYAALNRLANSLPEPPTLKVQLEYRLHGREISLSTARSLKTLEPYGNGNPEPLFYIRSVQITELSPVGNGHTRVNFNCDGFEVKAVMFGTEKNGFDFKVNDIVDLAVQLGVNIYKNNEYLSVIIRNIRKSACFGYYKGLYRMFLSGRPVETATLRLKLKPNRVEFAAVYRLLCSGNGKSSFEEIFRNVRRTLTHFDYFKAMLIIDVFAELGLITYVMEDDKDTFTYSINKDAKIDLKASKLLRRLG